MILIPLAGGRHCSQLVCRLCKMEMKRGTMAIVEIQCPHCQGDLRTQLEWQGMTMQCPSCGQAFIFTSDLMAGNPFAGGAAVPQMNLNIRKPPADKSMDWDEWQRRIDTSPPRWTTALDKYADFSGRSSRAEYWLFMLHIAGFTYLLNIFTVVLAIFTPIVAAIIYIIACCYYLYLLIPCISVTVRRLHDVNLSGLFALVLPVPVFGYFFLHILFSVSRRLNDFVFFVLFMGVGGISFICWLFITVISCWPSAKKVNKWGENPNGRNPDTWWPCAVGIFVWYILPWLLYIALFAVIFTFLASHDVRF